MYTVLYRSSVSLKIINIIHYYISEQAFKNRLALHFDSVAHLDPGEFDCFVRFADLLIRHIPCHILQNEITFHC